ncbi:hydrolase, partial [Halobacteriales archaeon QH_2_66_30]
MVEEWQATALEDGSSGFQDVTVPGRPAAFAGAEGVRYRTRFDDPRDPGDDVAVVELEGVYARAEVEATGERLDGDWVAEHDAYFEPLRIPFRPGEENELVVTCRAPGDRFGGIHDSELVPEELRVPGIWWDATIETCTLPTIDSLTVTPEVTEEGARLHVETTVLTDGPIDERITYSLRPEGDLNARGMMERESVEIDAAGKTTVEHTVEIRDPALWWPRELGRQHHYTLTAKLDGAEHSQKTGFCEVGFEDGQFRVNGEPLNVRGVNLLTDSPEDVDRALSVNANLLRAHAQVLPEAVYERCDEEGLLVWQDLPLTGPGGFDKDRGKYLARTLSRQYGAHPSLAAYGVHDDPVDAFASGLGSGFLDGLRLRWRAWRSDYDAALAEEVADAFPDTRPVFPVVGGPGVDGDAASHYPGWDYGDAADIDTLLERYPAAVVAEYGAGALPADADGAAADAAGFDAAKHDRRVPGNHEDSQAYQASLLQTISERLRADRVPAVAFSLRDTDTAGMGIFAHDGTPKASTETLARSFAPLQAFLADP